MLALGVGRKGVFAALAATGALIVAASSVNCGTNFQVVEVHPDSSDFPFFDTQGRILISKEHGGTYYTMGMTTASNGPAQTQPGMVTISAYAEPKQEGKRVYFEVIDPDDTADQFNASYVEDKTPTTPFLPGDSDGVNTAPNDNRDPAKNMVGGTYAEYTAFQNSVLPSGRSALTELKMINGVQRAVAEVTLTITDQYAGDNYIVRATTSLPNNKPFNDDSGVTADPNADAEIPNKTIKSTETLVAWKRIYFETDKMFRVGADLSADSGSDQPNKKIIHVATGALNLAANDTVQILDTDDQLSPFGEVRTAASVTATEITLTQDMIGDYDMAKKAHVGKLTDASTGGFEAFYEADTSDFTSLFGEDGGCVDTVDVATGSGPVPLKIELEFANSEEKFFSNDWFHLPEGNRKNYFHVIGAHSSDQPMDIGGTPDPEHPTNAAFVYVKRIEMLYPNDIPEMVKSTTAHELTHQFDDKAPPPVSMPPATATHHNPAEPGVVPGTGDDCVMTYTGVAGFDPSADSKWGVFHVYGVRDEVDAQ